MKKKKISKASKRRLALFGSIATIIIIYFFFSLFFYITNIYKLKSEKNDLKTSLVELKQEEKALKTTIEKLKDPEYLARYARENYLYTKPDELVLDVREKNNNSTKIEDVNKTNYTYILIGFGSLILIFIYIIKKNKKSINN